MSPSSGIRFHFFSDLNEHLVCHFCYWWWEQTPSALETHLKRWNPFCFLSHAMFISMTMTKARQTTCTERRVFERLGFCHTVNEQRDSLSPNSKEEKPKTARLRVSQSAAKSINHRPKPSFRKKLKRKMKISRVLHSFNFGATHQLCGVVSSLYASVLITAIGWYRSLIEHKFRTRFLGFFFTRAATQCDSDFGTTGISAILVISAINGKLRCRGWPGLFPSDPGCFCKSVILSPFFPVIVHLSPLAAHGSSGHTT